MSRRGRRPSGTLLKRLEGAKTQDWRRKAFKKQDGLCAYCDTEMILESDQPKFHRSRMATLDHVIPRSRGGEHHWENVVAACYKCNQAKGDMTAEEFCPEKFAVVCEEVE